MSESVELITAAAAREVLLHGGEIQELDPEAVAQQIVESILTAETLEQAWGGFEATSMKDLEGSIVSFHDVRWMKSSYTDGPAVYALIQAQVEGEPDMRVVSCGGRSMMAGLLWTQLHDAFPVRGVPSLKQSRSNPDKSVWTFSLT